MDKSRAHCPNYCECSIKGFEGMGGLFTHTVGQKVMGATYIYMYIHTCTYTCMYM